MLARMLALAPLWPLQLLTAAKSFEDNPLIGSRLFNEWGLHAWRVRTAHRLATQQRQRLAMRLAEADRMAFDREGYLVRRNFLSTEAFAALRDQVAAYRGPIQEKTEGRSLLRKVAVKGKVMKHIPSLGQLAALPAWNDLLGYVGARDAKARLYLQAVVQNACEGEADPQTLLHADTFHPTVKAWLFLTDVRPDEGPFTYVPGSHRLTRARLDWERRTSLSARGSSDGMTRQGSFRIDESELDGLGLPRPIAVAVPENTLVVADTFGFHARGQSVRPSVRVEVWGIGPRNPFLPWASADRVIAWLSRDRSAADNPWHRLEGKSLFDGPGV